MSALAEAVPSAAPGRRFWFDAQGLHLDVRDLTPPAPMIEALRLLAALRDDQGDGVLLHTPHLPMHLLPELEERGWAWEVLVADGPDGALLRLERSRP